MSAKLAFIAAHASEHAIRLMCRVLGIARGWFHAWRRAAPLRAERAARRQDLFKEIREIFEASKQRYGAPRIHAELHDRGRGVSKRTIAKLMKENGIRPPRGRRRAPITTDSRHAHAVAPNLLERNFEVLTPDTVWLADISYIPTDEGWLYLAAVIESGERGLERRVLVADEADERAGHVAQPLLRRALGQRLGEPGLEASRGGGDDGRLARGGGALGKHRSRLVPRRARA